MDTSFPPPSLPSIPPSSERPLQNNPPAQLAPWWEGRKVSDLLYSRSVMFAFNGRNEIPPSVQGRENSGLWLKTICATTLMLCYLAGKVYSRGKCVFAVSETSCWRDFLQRCFSPRFFGVLPALDESCSASGRAAGSGAGHWPCSVSSLNRVGVIPALPWTKCLKPAHLLSRAWTRGRRRFWAAVRDWKNLDNHKEKFFLIKVIERVEMLGCNEISCVGCPHW